MRKKVIGKPYEGELHVRFDEEELVKSQEETSSLLYRFVTDPDVDSTNNISERELRELVIIRKISNGSRSPRGANATAMLLSIIQTLRFNKQNVLEGLQNILNNPSGC